MVLGKDSVEYEIFKKYERALVTIGVNFSLEQVQEALEACNRLVTDVFYDEGTEFIKFTNGKEILVETAWRWEWEQGLQYASS
ncbi:hypothetical protein FBB35_06855 [Nostoc sp. TCL240-02]|nr:hypothetical protein FBB35_06855 [Nostoc sp. TCL240-02]